MNNSRYTLDDKQISDISLKDLARRSRYGGIFYLFPFLATTFSSTAAREHLVIIGIFSVCFALLQAYRLILSSKVSSSFEMDSSLIHNSFAFIYNASAITWVCGAAWLFHVSPSVDIAVTAHVMASAGISIGSVIVLAPSYTLLRNYCLLICLPFAFSVALFMNGPGNWIIAGLTMSYGLFVFITGKQLNRAYWQALNDNLKLSIQAEELEKAKVEAELAGQAKADFLAAMTHEIRTPMNGILGMAQLLSMGKLNEEQQQQVTTINNAGQTLMHVINDILDYSKINAEQLELEKRSFSVHQVINEVILLLSPQFEKKSIKLNCTINNIPDFVRGDPYRLHQILHNLVGNAFKFTDTGEVSIDVCCQESHDENIIMMSFSVRDTGIGVAPQDQQQIFEQFYQVNPFNSNVRGTGLGLSITQRLVELMGGTISLESCIEVGSVFIVELPFTLADAEDLNDLLLKPIEKSDLEIESDVQPSLHILLVEDNRINQILCEQFLIKLGCTVDFAETGKRALDKFNGFRQYDVIFMDCNMPEMDGFSATLNIRQIEKEKQLDETPIVALTAHIGEDTKRKCLESGMNVFLSKPFLFEDLETIIKRARAGKLL